MLLAPRLSDPSANSTTRLITCTECRRRHQKCNPKEKGPCGNCLRRFPPPKCNVRVVTKLLARTQELSLLKAAAARKFDQPRNSAKAALRSKKSTISSTAVTVAVQNAMTGRLEPFGGIVDLINTLESLSLKPTRRNAELFHFYHQTVVPRFASIDAQDTPSEYLQHVVPWAIQCPLMPLMAILMSSGIRAIMKGVRVSNDLQTLEIKCEMLALVNKFIQDNPKGIGIQAACAVLHLASAELMSLKFGWGSFENMWMHLEGLKQMIQLQGGIGAIEDKYLIQATILTDYKIAIFFERDLCLHNPEADKDFPLLRINVPKTFPLSIYSPLHTSPTPFSAHKATLHLTTEAAEILDNIQFLTTSITRLTSPAAKIQSTAVWLHDRILSTPTPDITPQSSSEDLIAASIHLTALVYTSSIATLTPISKTFPPSKLQELHTYVFRVGFSRWKEISGVFLWIMLTACSAGEVSTGERKLQFKMAVTKVAIACVSFDCIHAYVKAFWGVQRWISREGERTGDVLVGLQKVGECVVM